MLLKQPLLINSVILKQLGKYKKPRINDEYI